MVACVRKRAAVAVRSLKQRKTIKQSSEILVRRQQQFKKKKIKKKEKNIHTKKRGQVCLLRNVLSREQKKERKKEKKKEKTRHREEKKRENGKTNSTMRTEGRKRKTRSH